MPQINRSVKRNNSSQKKGMMSMYRSIDLVVNSVALILRFQYSKLDKKCSPAEYCALMRISRHFSQNVKKECTNSMMIMS